MIFTIDNPADRGYLNDPSVVVEGVKVHRSSLWRHKRYDIAGTNRFILVGWSPSGEICSYTYVDPANQRGFGGQEIKYNIDGVLTTIKGSWRSRASLVNDYLPVEDHIVDVFLKDQRLSIGYLKSYVEKAGIKFRLDSTMDNYYYIPKIE